MQSTANRVVIASAGSGKTTFLVEEALALPDKRIAMLTYTNNNVNEIRRKYCEKRGVVPSSVDVVTWFSFLLHECARPYQRSVYSKRRVRAICFPDGRSDLYATYADTERYYFRHGDEIYADKIARFVIDCERESRGLVTKRLGDIYDEILIDEFQDLSGWDLSLLEDFLRAGIHMIIVGDPRQCIYATNQSAKNAQYRGIGVWRLLRKWEASNLCGISAQASNYRSNQKICDFANRLFPDMVNMESRSSATAEHDGVFVVSRDNLDEYMRRFSPAVLRYDKKTRICEDVALNFGNAKGLEFKRVLIIPHGPIRKYLKSGDLNDVKGSLSKFYVAVTRAKHSVAFLYDEKCVVGCTEWKPKAES